MAAVGTVFTIRRVAELLGRDKELLWEIANQLEPENGALRVHHVDDAETRAFTMRGIEALQEIISNQIDGAS